MTAVSGESIWLDGKWVHWTDANIHILTHTLHYGLGVFEGIRCYETADGRSAIFRLPEHVRRLFESAHINLLDVPFSEERVSEICLESLRRNGLSAGYVRPLVFLGDGEMGLHPGSNPVRVAVAAWSWGKYLGDEGLARGIRAKISTFSRHHVNAKMTKGKTCGDYVNSVLAKREALLDGYDEAIMLDTQGLVSEATGENLFVVRDGAIATPTLHSILGGITRATVIELARDAGIEVQERAITRDELYVADEVFLTGSGAGLVAVRSLDDRPVGGGRGMSPGTLAARLDEALVGSFEKLGTAFDA